MSNQYQRNRNESNKNFPKPQTKYVPKTPQIPNQTLSTSLRQSLNDASSRAAASSTGNFVNYLPQDEAVAVGRGADDGGLDPIESQRVVDLLNSELSRLLKLNPKSFWKQVSSNTSLHEFLESFLKFRSRWYDFPYHGTRGMVAGVIVGEFDLSRRVFMLLYRISSNRDPGARAADSLTPRDHSCIATTSITVCFLLEKKLLDLPKLLDVCAIYARENEDHTRLLVENAIKAQPGIHDNLTAVVSQFLTIANTMYQRCSSSLEVLFSSADGHEQGFSHQYSDYLEVMDFINDAVVSMDGFVGAYKHAAVFFCSHVEMSVYSHGNEEVLKTLSRLHDSLVPSLRRGFQVIHAAGKDGATDDMISNIAISLKMLSARIVNFGWKLVYFCYLSDEVFEGNSPLPPAMKMFPANVEDPVIRADILIQSFRDIIGDNLEGHNQNTFLHNMERTNKIMRRVQVLQNTGWMLLDNEQIQYLSRILNSSLEEDVKESPHGSSLGTSKRFQAEEDVVMMESQISQVKDLFPEYGKGYIAACLEVYNQNPEEVIQRILEGTLHEDLLSLDVSLEKIPQTRSAPSVKLNDKGKGKLTEDAVPSGNILPPVNTHQVGGSSTSSTGGRYIRKDKTDIPDSKTLDARSGKDLAKTAALALQLEYEDEYDDSFDDLGMDVGDSGFEEAETGDNSTSQRSKQHKTSASSETRDATNTKWGSKRAPQFYVKDGKNYSYKVAGSVAAANYNDATLINQVQKDQIHGLGRGGNIPMGPSKRAPEYMEGQDDASDMNGGEVQSRFGNFRGGRGGGRRGGMNHSISGSTEEQDDPSKMKEGEGQRGTGNFRGGRGGRRGGRNHSISGSTEEQTDPSAMKEGEGQPGPENFRGGRGGRSGGRNHNRKDRALKKHFSGISGSYAAG